MTRRYITLDPDQQEPLYQLIYIKIDPHQQMFYYKNRIHMLLYNTGSRPAGAFIPVDQDQHGVI